MTRCWEAALSLLASVYLKISGRQREEAKEKRSVSSPPLSSLVHMFSQSVTSPSCSPSLSNLPSFPRVCHGFDSSSVPLFNNVAAAHPPCPIPYPAPPPPIFFTEADTVQKKSTMGCINHVAFEYPQRTQNSLSSVFLPLPLLLSSLDQPREDLIPRIRNEKQRRSLVKKDRSIKWQLDYLLMRSACLYYVCLQNEIYCPL